MKKQDKTARRSQPRTAAPKSLSDTALSEVKGGHYHDIGPPQPDETSWE